ncbi:MAG: energy-coupling factor ABC transporter permease [Angustibacter sp.]
MHISDGIVNAPVSVAFGVVAAAGVGYAAARARRDLDDRTTPMAGLVAAFVFAVQMINFPVLPGVSGHLLGGALATLLVGPWLGMVCVAVVLLVQALLFADGGLSALGLNITNMAVVTSLVAAGLVAVLVRRAQPTRRSITVVGFVVSVLAVLAGSSAFIVQYALGGTLEVSLTTVATLQLGYHTLIGIGEGVITAVTVASVAASRPDLVWALRRRAVPAAPVDPAAHEVTA